MGTIGAAVVVGVAVVGVNVAGTVEDENGV